MKNILIKDKIASFLTMTSILIGFNACSDWLDVVPEGTATIDMVFNSRAQAIKFLSTCYAYMPRQGNVDFDPGMLGGDELCTYISAKGTRFQYTGYYLANGMQNANEPLFDIWSGAYQGLRNCNIFLENLGRVPDLPDWERDQWIAEIKVLKAYLHFCLVQAYGPVPLIRDNIPVSADVSKVKVIREPVDDCFRYIVELIDEATEGDILPVNVLDVSGELGRITKPIALALKAKVLVTAASPLFNGNSQQATLRNLDGTQLFNQKADPEKWVKAANACREAIKCCHEAEIALYKFPVTATTRLTDTIITQLSLLNAFNLRWNSEIIWANTQSIADGLQRIVTPRLNTTMGLDGSLWEEIGIPLKIAEMFYTEHGVPLEEDNTRDLNRIYDLRAAQPQDKLYIKPGSTTVDLHFDREPRFYAWVGFDCGIWYGQGRNDDKAELWALGIKNGEFDCWDWQTGYLPKKYLPYTNVLGAPNLYSITPYPWPIMRLSDLYLLYAEAINEVEGPNGQNSAELFYHIDAVRKRAGLDGVKKSWDDYTGSPKYNTQDGMRKIIQQERMIELSFEGHRFWDIRRWKTAPDMYRRAIEGWNGQGSTAVTYYSRVTQYNQKFGIRDYFWPIKNSELVSNPNLVQNIGW